jgi:hypothetical protein
VKQETPDQLRARMSRMGKARMQWPKWRRQASAWHAGKQGGRPVVIDHAKVHELRNAGKKHREIAAEMNISMPSVSRILAARPAKKRG